MLPRKVWVRSLTDRVAKISHIASHSQKAKKKKLSCQIQKDRKKGLRGGGNKELVLKGKESQICRWKSPGDPFYDNINIFNSTEHSKMVNFMLWVFFHTKKVKKKRKKKAAHWGKIHTASLLITFPLPAHVCYRESHILHWFSKVLSPPHCTSLTWNQRQEGNGPRLYPQGLASTCTQMLDKYVPNKP